MKCYEINYNGNIYFGILVNNFLKIGEMKSKIVRIELMIKNNSIIIHDIITIHEYYRDFSETREIIQVAIQMAINLFQNINFKYVKFNDNSDVSYHIDITKSIMFKNGIDRTICAFGTANLSDLTFLVYGCSWYQFMMPYLRFKFNRKNNYKSYKNYKTLLFVYNNYDLYKNLNNDKYRYQKIMQSFNIDSDYNTSNSWAEFLYKKSYKVNEICNNIVDFLLKNLNIESMTYTKWYAKLYKTDFININYKELNEEIKTIIEKPYYKTYNYSLVLKSKWNPLNYYSK